MGSPRLAKKMNNIGGKREKKNIKIGRITVDVEWFAVGLVLSGKMFVKMLHTIGACGGVPLKGCRGPEKKFFGETVPCGTLTYRIRLYYGRQAVGGAASTCTGFHR